MLVTASIGIMLIWTDASPEILFGAGTVAMLMVAIYEFRQNHAPELRRRSQLLLGGTYAFLAIAYVLSLVPS
jgi:hypothetical protein